MKTTVLMRTCALWAGLVALIDSIALLQAGASAWWYGATFVSYMLILVTITVGYHRLFTHRAFACHRLWHWLFMLIGSASLQTSTVQWVANHEAHHAFADTERDPHERTWRYFFRLHHKRHLTYRSRRAKWLMRDRIHALSYRYSGLMFALAGLVCMLASWKLFIFAFMLPIALSVFAGGMHSILSHGAGGARTLWFMEFLLPNAGEWMHAHHHRHPRDWNFSAQPWEFDLGALLIRAIRDD
ncbi:MAG TPA: hypothetical protein VL051_09505 [Burkholderiaceae bacterium]|nr:hypothetical protein [Burkholderiaceae bacterium]